MKIVPNVSAPIYTTSAFIIGILLADDLTPAEQNSLGNWFMMIGQALCTNASQQQLLNNRKNISNSSNTHIINNNDLINAANNIKQNINDLWQKK